MINSSRHDHQIIGLKPDANPIVVLAADVKVAAAITDVPDLLVLVQMLVEEGLDFVLVVGQQRRGDGDLVAVLVATRGSEGVDVGYVWVVEVEDTELR